MVYYTHLQGTVCQSCSNQYSTNCQVCSNHNCQKCYYPYFLHIAGSQSVTGVVNGQTTTVIEQCVTTCPSGTYGRIDNGRECVNCSMYCASCTSYSQCTICISPYHLVNGYCTVDCPIGTFTPQVTVGGTVMCSPCPTTCVACSSTDNCTSCPSGKYLSYSPTLNMTTCVSNCPNTYFPDTSGWCFKCPSTCVSCHNLTSCTSCLNGYSLSSGLCINTTNTTCINNCA